MQTEVRYIDLCCGIGGFRVALNNMSNLNTKCVLSVDIKQDAIDTYNANFQENNKITDIYSLKIDEIEQFDLLCAGFPCQPFSSAGHKKGFSDKRGGMIFKIIDICKYHKPSFVLLENVYNLMTLEKGKCMSRIKVMFEQLGYNVFYQKLNTRNFGCAQSRERVYIVCMRDKHIIFDSKLDSNPNVYLKSVIDDSVKTSDIDPIFCEKIMHMHKNNPIFGKLFGDKRGGKNNIHSWDIGYNGVLTGDEKELMEQIMLNRRKKHWAEKKNIVWMDGMPLTFDDIHSFNKSDVLQIMLDKLVMHKYLRIEKPKDLVDGKRQYKEDAEDGYNICKGKLSFPISKILDPSDVSPTLTATDSHKLAVIINDTILRHLTSNEMKKISGFPETFIVPNHVNYFDLFGNMAAPPVLEYVMKIMFNEH